MVEENYCHKFIGAYHCVGLTDEDQPLSVIRVKNSRTTKLL